MYILECEDYEDVLTWEPSGLSFVIIDPKEFQKRVLPEIFKGAKLSSFHRKLLRWSFVKRSKKYSYSHPNFKRGDWAQCSAMRGGNPTQNNWRQHPGIFSHSIWPQISISKSPSTPSLAAASAASDGSTIFSTRSSNSRGNSYQGSTFTLQNQQTSVHYNFPENNTAFFASNAAASTTTSTNTAPSLTSYLKQSQDLKLLTLIGKTEDEILKDAYATLNRSL
mmetsp:Transcript_2748/g.3148  ORF Transcript_2748/g.3148 Transcript_2748/m.3148 type:complete len:222 (-) Transcript_2748:223-888(-)